MIKFINNFIFIGIITLNSPSLANSQFYTLIEGGVSKANNYSDYTPGELNDIDGAKSSISPVYGIELGYKFNDRFSSGFAFSHTHYDYAKAHPSKFDGLYTNEEVKFISNSYLCNLYYNFIVKENYNGYFLVGAGIANNKSSDFNHKISHINYIATDLGKSTLNFAWQVGAGLELLINDKTSFNLLIKYFNYGKTRTQDNLFVNNVKHPSLGHMGTKLNGISLLIGLKIYL